MSQERSYHINKAAVANWSSSTVQIIHSFQNSLYRAEGGRHDFTCFKSVHLKHRFPNSGIIHQKVKRGFIHTCIDFRLTGFTCFHPAPGEPLQFLFSQDCPYRLLSNIHQMLLEQQITLEGHLQRAQIKGSMLVKFRHTRGRGELLLYVDNLNIWHGLLESFTYASKYFFQMSH